MKKIILTSLLFSLATLVNATPTDITTSPTILSINENTATGTTIGTASGNGSGNHSYAVQEPTTFSFNVGVSGGDFSSGNNFRVRPAGNSNGDNDITIATLSFNAGPGNDTNNPAAKLTAAINLYDDNNGSGVRAEIGSSNSNSSGEVVLTAWPHSLNGAELIGFNTNNNYAITIVSTGTAKIITTPSTSDFFSIDAATGVLKSKVVFNHEEKASYTIVIRATDNDGSYSKDFAIQIINLADTPTDIIPNTTTLSIQENNGIGDTIGTFSTVDGNDGNHTYTLTGATDNNFFSIDNNGVLTADVVFDFEERQSYTVTINTDDGTAFHAVYSESFIINIGNIDDVSTLIDITLSSTTVAENNAIGTTVGNLATLATLGGSGPYTYSIDTSNKNFTFTVQGVDRSNPADNLFSAIEPNGTSKAIARVNYSYANNTSVVDKLITGDNDDYAINKANAGGFYAEKVDETTVRLTDWDDKFDGGRLDGPDETSTDNEGLIDYIKITSSTTLPSPAPFSIDGDKLITTAVLDKATQSSYTITINSTDKNNTVISKDFTITVADAGTVTSIFISKNTITNQATDGATVGLLSTNNATDTGRVYVLENNTATFSISGDKLTANNPGSLTIVGATYTVYVSTLNGDNTIFTQSLTITVTNDPIFSLDVDGNGTINAPNDGLIIFKYLLNSNANNLHTTIASDTPDGRKTTPQLKAYLDDAGTILDVDGNGTINAPNDGLIIFKYLLNSNANNLHTTIASDAPDGKKTTPQLKAYLDLYSE